MHPQVTSLTRSLKAAFATVALVAGCALAAGGPAQANPAPKPIDAYPAAIPLSTDTNIANWEKLQFGMFVHWGMFSSYGGYYNGVQQTIGYPEQIKAWMNIPTSDYLAGAHQFTADKFDAAQWCATAKAAGAKYLVLTSKHHDGFAMWDTATTDYNVVAQTPFGRDPIKELSSACRAQGMGFGLYFSIIDWTLQTPEPYQNLNPIPDSMMPYIKSQLTELLTKYGQLDELWFDMGKPTAAQSAEMAATVHRLQPQTMVNSRVWNNKGDFEVGGDNSVPTKQLQAPWQSAYSIFPMCWGYCTWPSADRSDASKTSKTTQQVRSLFTVTSGGGNYLLNVGPQGNGAIDDFQAGVMAGIGAWNARHPNAVEGARPTLYGRMSWGDSTIKGNAVYLGVSSWPNGGGDIRLPGMASTILDVTVDGTADQLPYRTDGNDLVITLPAQPTDADLPVIKVHTDGAPLVRPAGTAVSADRHFSIAAGSLTSRLSPINGGRNASSVTGWLAGQDGNSGWNAARVTVSGTFKADTKYRITLGETSVVATGAQLASGAVDGLRYRSQRITPITIAPADPDYFADPLGATVTNITVDGYRGYS